MMDRRTVIKGATAGVAVALLPTLPVEEVKYVKTVTIGNMRYNVGDYVFMQFSTGKIQTVVITKIDEKGDGYYKNIWGYEVPIKEMLF
jgi:hypothetical protein